MSYFEAKNLARAQYKSLIISFPAKQRQTASARICAWMEKWPIYQEIQSVTGFCPMTVEPNILPLLQITSAVKTVCLVRMPLAGSGTLETRRWDGHPDSIVARANPPLSEASEDLPLIELPARTLVLVPGLAFADNGARLGRGQAWYDRFLNEKPGLIRVGICFDIQICDHLPEEEWDARMDYIVSDKGIITCNDRLRT